MSEPEASDRWKFPRPYGQYELLDRLGKGGMAEVFKARRAGAAGFEKILVIKRILPHLASQAHFVSMFVNEAKIAAQIQHQNVVQVFDLGQSADGELYIAMEYVAGLDVRKLLAHASDKRLRVPIWISLHIVREVLNALVHAHDLTDNERRAVRVIHRDVTPANVFISEMGEIKLADFGIAKAIGDNPDTEAGQIKGNVSYMAPEALLGEPLDPRADVFSVGVVLWELLTQQRLFQGRSNFETARMICDSDRPAPSRLLSDVPPELDPIVLTALEVDKDRRYPTAHDFLLRVVDALSALRPRLLRADVREAIEILTGKIPPTAEFNAPAQRTGSIPIPPASTWSIPRTPPTQTSPVAPATAPQSSSGIPAATTGTAVIAPLTSAAIAPLSSSGPIVMVPGSPIPGTSIIPPPTAPRAGIPAYFPAVAPTATRDIPRPAPEAFETIPLGGALLAEWVDGPGTVSQDSDSIDLKFTPHHATGGIFVRDTEGRVVGPYSYEDLVRVRGLKPAAVSADKARWMDIKTFVQLSGIDRLSQTPRPIRRATLVGKLETRSLCSILGQLGRERQNGRLIIIEGTGNNSARREIEVVNGAPIFVFSDHPSMQLPELLVRHKIVNKDQLDTLLVEITKREQPLLDLISWTAFTDVTRYWPLIMRDRLSEVFRWAVGRFAFDAEMEPPRAAPFARSLLQVLFDSVLRSFNTAELTSMLGSRTNAKLVRNEGYTHLLRGLSLTEKQAEIADRLAPKRTISELLRKYPQDSHPLAAMAYVLLEIGAISPG
ncbi:MAG: protein kinase [Myxococcota bacterium]